MEQLYQYGIAGAALGAVVYLLRFLIRAYIAASAKELSEQRQSHKEDARQTRDAFLGALDKQQDVFTTTLKDERRDCAERHAEILKGHADIMGKLNSIDGKLLLGKEKNP